MNLGRLSYGERIASASALLLFVLTFFHWFSVKLINTSNLLFAIRSVLPGKNAWEALEYIPIVLVITIIVTLASTGLRLMKTVHDPLRPVSSAIAFLGIVSALLILYRIIDPPIFYTDTTVRAEGVAQLPIFLALAAAAGIAFGGFLTMRQRSVKPSSLRAGARVQEPGRTSLS